MRPGVKLGALRTERVDDPAKLAWEEPRTALAVPPDADIVLVEGAGSASEINLRKNDIANMGFARAADVPVILLGDIDRGGVIASLVGTKAVIDPADAAMIVGFIVNRFRGDPTLFEDGMKLVAKHTGWQVLGLVPFFAAAHKLPAEDALGLPSAGSGGRIKIAVNHRYALADAAKAHADLEGRRTTGAIVLTV